MAKLFINKDIAADSEKIGYWLSCDDCVSYNDVQSFLDFYKDDSRIDVELHSCGGSCIEGYAIYDALRASGKEISCTLLANERVSLRWNCGSSVKIAGTEPPKSSPTASLYAS